VKQKCKLRFIPFTGLRAVLVGYTALSPIIQQAQHYSRSVHSTLGNGNTCQSFHRTIYKAVNWLSGVRADMSLPALFKTTTLAQT